MYHFYQVTVPCECQIVPSLVSWAWLHPNHRLNAESSHQDAIFLLAVCLRVPLPHRCEYSLLGKLTRQRHYQTARIALYTFAAIHFLPCFLDKYLVDLSSETFARK